MVKFKFLAQFTNWSPCPPSCVYSYTTFCANLLDSIIIWLIASSLSPHNLHLLSSSRYIDASTLSSVLANALPPSFLDTYSLSTSSLGCKALCMVISFLVLCSICLSSSLVHFKNGPEYLMMRTEPLIRFLLESFVSSSFLVLLRYSFSIFSFPLVL